MKKIIGSFISLLACLFAHAQCPEPTAMYQSLKRHWADRKETSEDIGIRRFKGK
ncbi:hypothetical protein MKQ68_16545 [Chitinophaga horti]|uniref:Uncharacterized protein n=1 Tax=Chitinophaga horti TaxID=2920382 RepID=A0ABY6IWE6_9BACT|nr:hypothetical protein [Chitinophaga horti]UYQ91699.1 hypothetical protein MKQ68_16545 [Chitinophaga horti]